MNNKKYVDLKIVMKVFQLIEERDRFYEGSERYQAYSREVKRWVSFLEKDAKNISELLEDIKC